jgi:hypothetical protein
MRDVVSHAVGRSDYTLVMHGGDRGGLLLRLLGDILAIDRRIALLVLLLFRA